MPTLIDFRRRIRSVKNTQQITRAMKFVAAARLRRAQEGVFAARPYAREMQNVLRSAMARIERPAHPLLARREEKRLLLLVLSGDKGLCGAFNTNVLRRALEFIREHADRALQLVALGKRGRDALRKRKYSFQAEYINIFSSLDFARAREVAAKVIEQYAAGEADAVYAIYNEFKNVLVQRLVTEKLLPVEGILQTRFEGALAIPGHEGYEGAPATPAEPAGQQGEAEVDYIYEQPLAELLELLLPRHVEMQVYRALLESGAAEQAARMTAMDAATNNAADMIDRLTLHMNKVRQAQITKELIEIVSGAAAL